MYFKKSINSTNSSGKIFLLIFLLVLISYANSMTLMNSCTTDNDCPPSWDKNAIFCSTPIYSKNSELSDSSNKYRRQENGNDDVIIYDGTQLVEIDENKPETLSQSSYNKVCISYRPMGYPCKIRSDCLATDEVELPYIQCVNFTCTDLGKTTGNYMKNIRGNHKKKSKYWYIGIGLGIITSVIVLGCVGLLLYGKKKKNEELKIEEKIKKANENDICGDNDEDNGIMKCDGDYVNNFNNNRYFDYKDDKFMNTKIDYYSKSFQSSDINISKNNNKPKRSILNMLSFGIFDRISTTTVNNNNSNDILDHSKINNLKGNFKIDEIDLSNKLEYNYFQNDNENEKITINKNKKLKHKKSKFSISKYNSIIDPEKTLVRNLHKKNSKNTVNSVGSVVSTKINMEINDESSINSNNYYSDANELSSVASTLYDNNTLKNKLYDSRKKLSSSFDGNFENNNEEENLSINENEYQNENYFNSENYLGQGINKVIHKDLVNKNDQLVPNEKKKQFDYQYNNNEVYKPIHSLTRNMNNISNNNNNNDTKLKYSDYYQKPDNKESNKELSYILPQIPQVPISEIVASTFGSISSDEDFIDDQVEKQKYLKIIKDANHYYHNDYTPIKYSTNPTSYDSIHEYKCQNGGSKGIADSYSNYNKDLVNITPVLKIKENQEITNKTSNHSIHTLNSNNNNNNNNNNNSMNNIYSSKNPFVNLIENNINSHFNSSQSSTSTTSTTDQQKYIIHSQQSKDSIKNHIQTSNTNYN
ncbi:hypothetical protein BCR36DRAFT_416741 [Piromyces finnis]|uniref:Uncharacterized protein n=1 Tax=Piromyces finnis TaxID=1754191 RepID=A0A1Y1UV71_9FUNG|nr:hypothetical protein BCR36DRAFT_416741 [Piromyces finnis]|eukprot:ORX41485.1 hypothetical protein BCR36DRAFT_416741 [Piromyces finnis]